MSMRRDLQCEQMDALEGATRPSRLSDVNGVQQEAQGGAGISPREAREMLAIGTSKCRCR